MSRKDYVSAARIIRATVDKISAAGDGIDGPSAMMAASEIAHGLASMFAMDNPRFSRTRFFDACGITDTGR